MAIVIKPIPVLTGKAAERFNRLAENVSARRRTIIPEDMRQAIKRMQDRSRKLVIK